MTNETIGYRYIPVTETMIRENADYGDQIITKVTKWVKEPVHIQPETINPRDIYTSPKQYYTVPLVKEVKHD